MKYSIQLNGMENTLQCTCTVATVSRSLKKKFFFLELIILYMDNHNTGKKKSYQLYIRKTKDIQELVDLGLEMYYEDPEAKRTWEKGQREV